MRKPTPKEFMRVSDALSIGMRLAYMHDRDLVELDTTVRGEIDLALFAYELSEKWKTFVEEEKNEDPNWDEYIEEAILEKYGKPEEEPDEPADLEMGFDPYLGCYTDDC